MILEQDPGLQIAREGSKEGLEDFQSKLDFYEKNPTPALHAGRHHGVPLPGMGARPTAAPATKPALSPAELAKWQRRADQIALQAMMEARRDFIPTLFRQLRQSDGQVRAAVIRYKLGKTPADEAREAAKDFRSRAKDTKESAEEDIKAGRSVAPTATPSKSVDLDKIRSLGKKAFEVLGELEPAEFLSLESTILEVAGDIFADLGSSLMPFVGTAKAGFKAGKGWYSAGKKQSHVQTAKKSRKQLILGDPEQALKGVQRLLERERNLLVAEAGIATAKLGASVAGYFADFGIASSVAASCLETVGRLTLHIRAIVRDARELKAGNELLQQGKFDAELFSACPLLGAYAVASADTSALVGFLGGDPQRHGFTLEDLARLVKKYNDPLVRYSTELISKSRFEVTGMPTDRAAARVKALPPGLKDRIRAKVREGLVKLRQRSPGP